MTTIGFSTLAQFNSAIRIHELEAHKIYRNGNIHIVLNGEPAAGWIRTDQGWSGWMDMTAVTLYHITQTLNDYIPAVYQLSLEDENIEGDCVRIGDTLITFTINSGVLIEGTDSSAAIFADYYYVSDERSVEDDEVIEPLPVSSMPPVVRAWTENFLRVLGVIE